jgi:plasmid stability protein
MAMLTVRNLPDDVHRALRLQAASHGHSTEAEVRQILANAVNPPNRIKMGQALAAIGRELGLTNQDVEAMEAMRQQKPAEPMGFE